MLNLMYTVAPDTFDFGKAYASSRCRDNITSSSSIVDVTYAQAQKVTQQQGELQKIARELRSQAYSKEDEKDFSDCLDQLLQQGIEPRGMTREDLKTTLAEFQVSDPPSLSVDAGVY